MCDLFIWFSYNNIDIEHAQEGAHKQIICNGMLHTIGARCLLSRKTIANVTNSRDSARSAKQQMQLYKAQIVQSVNDEYKEMMRRAVDEVSVESRCFSVSVRCKCTVVHMILNILFDKPLFFLSLRQNARYFVESWW